MILTVVGLALQVTNMCGYVPSESKLELLRKSIGAVTCFHCLSDSVIWDSDFSFEDCGYEGEGIVHICHCTNYGAEIEYRIRTDGEENA